MKICSDPKIDEDFKNLDSEKPKYQTIVLSSGGIDSTACINYYLKQNHTVAALFIDYGQISSVRENRAVQKITSYYKVPLKKLVIKGNRKWEKGFILGRNSFLLCSALLEFEHSSGIIAIGIHSGTSYSDCSSYFVEKIQDTFDVYANGSIRVEAPFIDWTKREIWDYSLNNKTPINLTYSCELGLKQPCGKCLSCSDLEALNAR